MSIKNRVARVAAIAQSRLPKALLRRRHGSAPSIDGYTLDLQVHAFQGFMASAAAKNPPPTVDVATVRSGFRSMIEISAAAPVASVSVHDRTIPGPAGKLAIRLYHPTRAEGRADAITFFHQGGGAIGDLDTDHTLCSKLAETCSAVVISVEYRLGPESPFPADVVDGLAAYQWVLDNASGLGINEARVAVAGTSQGGKIAAVVAQQRRREGLSVPFAQILAFPGLDATASGGSMLSMFDAWPLSGRVLQFFSATSGAGGEQVVDYRASPGLAPDLAGTPPTLIVNPCFDPLRDQGIAYAAALESAGVMVDARLEEALPHSFTVMGAVSREARRATDRLVTGAAKLLADS